MRKTMIWDLPNRLFHWIFVFGFIAAFAIAKLVGKRSDAFAYHMFIGLVVLVAIALRVIWMLVGTKYARIGSFLHSPATILGYLKGVFTGKGIRPEGRNPASSYASIAMVGLMIVIVVTGVMISRGHKEAEEIHELSTYLLLAVATIHVVGIIIHTVRFREWIGLSMIDGKVESDQLQSIQSTRPIAALVGLILLAGVIGIIFARYDTAARKLSLPGIGMVAKVPESKPGDFRRFREDHD